MGPRAGLDAVEKRKILFPCRESNPAVRIYSQFKCESEGNMKTFKVEEN
jgi:hypothetical protein